MGRFDSAGPEGLGSAVEVRASRAFWPGFCVVQPGSCERANLWLHCDAMKGYGPSEMGGRQGHGPGSGR